MKFRRKRSNEYTVFVVGDDDVNNLGVIRTLGRHKIPTILCSSSHQYFAKYSRYINQWLKLPDPAKSEDEYIESIINVGKHTEGKSIIIPTNDGAVIALSRNKTELAQYFILPFPDFDIVEKLVNKRMFYLLMEQLSIPYPKTYFPKDLKELKTIGKEIGYPYIIKPAYMHMFLAKFHVKCFYVNSPQMLDDVIQELENEELDVFLQEIIPGDDHYSLLTYFDDKSEPHAFCGWDKIQQDPPFFGNYSVLCKSIWREEPIVLAEKTLRMMKYHGIAEPEFKKDTRDNTYKLLEINARTSIPNALAAKCGTDITYIAYLDKTRHDYVNTDSPENGVLWVNDIFYFRNLMKLKFMKKQSLMDIVSPFKKKRVYAIAAWDDPIPFFSALTGLVYRLPGKILVTIKKIFRISNRKNINMKK